MSECLPCQTFCPSLPLSMRPPRYLDRGDNRPAERGTGRSDWAGLLKRFSGAITVFQRQGVLGAPSTYSGALVNSECPLLFKRQFEVYIHMI